MNASIKPAIPFDSDNDCYCCHLLVTPNAIWAEYQNDQLIIRDKQEKSIVNDI